ncbi:MAG: FGGY-family carbohydrate kinase [Pseudomonadota bacterium]
MSKRLALGIDVGTSGVRCAALRPDGSLEALTSAEMSEAGSDPRSPATWRDALDLALERMWRDVPSDLIGACAVDATSGTVLALDSAERPVGAVFMYNDPVDDPAILHAISSVAPRETAGWGANSGLARAMALQGRPGVTRILHQADWIAECLTGTPMPSDESNALKTGYDPVGRQWPAWLARTGLSLDLLPEVVPVGASTGRACGRFGLPSGVPMVAGVTDGCASFLATGAARPGEGVTALGTTLTIKLLSDRPVFAPEYGIYSHRIGDVWLAGGASNTGGGALAQYFTLDEIGMLSIRIDPFEDSGLDYYPLPKPGERFPVSDPDLAPRLEPRPADDAAFLHGLLEGVARIEAQGYRRLAELGAPALASIRTVGGGASNAVWQAMRHRILGVPGADVASDAAAAGVARLALPHLASP